MLYRHHWQHDLETTLRRKGILYDFQGNEIRFDFEYNVFDFGIYRGREVAMLGRLFTTKIKNIMIHKLEKIFAGGGEVKGFTFQQVEESDNGYIYSVCNGKSEHFETFKKKSTKVCLDFKERIYSDTDTKETYPKAKSFGVWAWTQKSLDEAYKRLASFDE